MPMHAGHKFRVFVNGTAYKAMTCRYRGTNEHVDASNSEGEPGNIAGGGITDLTEFVDFPYESILEGMNIDEVEVVNATYDPDDNRFDAPATIKRGMFIALEIQPIRLGGADAYIFPSALVVEVTHDMDLRRAQPLTFRARGDGRTQRPGDPLP
jgi:hypothetical protein